ncbi:fibronectin type III domain-containing protein, partial [Salmonella sp. SAL04284]|uniref:fibronectin type III domain-containing protein n=1 Tax=Salmonella sp. SAL04284 TaxID=3159862 RepID=UPI00397C1550
MAASNIGTTSLTLNWSNTKENSSIVSYRILNYYDPIATVSNTTHGYTVTGLTPQTVYTFRIEAVNDAGNLRLGPSTTIT